MSNSDRQATSDVAQKGSAWRDPKVIVAIISATATIIVALCALFNDIPKMLIERFLDSTPTVVVYATTPPPSPTVEVTPHQRPTDTPTATFTPSPTPTDTPTVTSILFPTPTDTPTATSTQTPPGFYYLVRVQAKDTGDYVQDAKVTIEVSGKAPLDSMTDVNGFARIFISHAYAEQPGTLIVEATGYQRYMQYIDLPVNALPNIVPLEPIAMPVSPTYTPTPTCTPTPTATRVLEIELLEPAECANYDGVTQITFSWRLTDVSAPLTAEEHFALRIWHHDMPEERHSITWQKELNYILDLYNKTLGIDFSAGYYYWNVGIVHEVCPPREAPGCWESHYESKTRLIYINKPEPSTPIPSPPPTDTPVPTQPPEPTNGPP